MSNIKFNPMQVDGDGVVAIESAAIVAGEIATGAVDTAEILDGAIVNADINAAAAIAYSKLNLAGSVDEADVTDSAGAGGLFVAKAAIAVYDFSVDGGTEGVITLASTATLPDNAVVIGFMYEVNTTFVSATDAATIKVNLPTDGDLSTAVAISNGGNPWDAGTRSFSVINSTGLAVKTTAARAIEITVGGGENLTAGKATFYLSYMVGA